MWLQPMSHMRFTLWFSAKISSFSVKDIKSTSDKIQQGGVQDDVRGAGEHRVMATRSQDMECDIMAEPNEQAVRGPAKAATQWPQWPPHHLTARVSV